MNARVTAGPAWCAATSPVSEKMPAPIVQPTPNAVSSMMPRERLSFCGPAPSASSQSVPTVLRDQIPNAAPLASSHAAIVTTPSLSESVAQAYKHDITVAVVAGCHPVPERPCNPALTERIGERHAEDAGWISRGIRRCGTGFVAGDEDADARAGGKRLRERRLRPQLQRGTGVPIKGNVMRDSVGQ